MIWTRSNTLALAAQDCTLCFGLGTGLGRAGVEKPCKCVLRAIFRACHARFRHCAAAPPRLTQSHIHGLANKTNKSSQRSAACGPAKPHKYGFPNSEYVADFLAIAKRTLGEDTLWFRIFTWHYLLGADYRLVNRKLGRPLGERETFHDFYRIEERLGRAFAETQPYGLYPLDEYFGGAVRGRAMTLAAV